MYLSRTSSVGWILATPWPWARTAQRAQRHPRASAPSVCRPRTTPRSSDSAAPGHDARRKAADVQADSVCSPQSASAPSGQIAPCACSTE
eukprot:CAMPEP_0183517854 /NCGR_PEP_ID=MMETSP0371-20130417/15150_1 /TAXON_ID=268820 /ORGANISM="Peridinium aciculiferum, Strain PAER-2" /LENGTH=89 /DNA_ID=CAMNT_0025715821 /DNA_START=295 /DNA_END=565 /DNA_ORIENTATION=-